MDNITGNIALTKLVNIDLNGKTLTGDITINTTATGSIALTGAGTITGDLNITALNATVTNNNTITGATNVNAVSYNSFISTGTHTGGIKMLGQGRLDLSGNASTATVTVETTEEVRLAGTVAKVIVNTANANVTVNNDGTVAEVEATQPVNLVNNGNVTKLSGTAAVTLSGEGEVTTVENDKVTVERENPDSSLVKGNELVEDDGVYSTSFNWKSTNGIGSKLVEKSGRYNYYNDGVYLDITVSNGSGNVAFNTLFEDMTLQTDGGNVDSIKGTAGRQQEDWNGTDGQWRTKLKESDSKSVFYGVRQTGTSTDVGVTRTVGFNADESRNIDLVLTPKSDIAAGTYTIKVDLKQQTGPTSGDSLEAITYEIVVPEEQDTQAPTAALTGFNSNSITLSFDEAVKFDGTALESVDVTDKVSFIKSLFVENSRYDLLDLAMDPDNIEITTTNKSVTLTLKNNALKKNIFQYLDDPEFKVDTLPELNTGNKDGMYKMDAEIDLNKFADAAGNEATGTISNPFKIQYNVTVNGSTPDYNSDVVAKFVTE